MEDRVNILLVDDQPRNLDVLEAILGPLEVQLVRAVSADEALLALLRGSFAAMVLDIKMPGTDGIELARLIKQRKRTRDIPILFLTAHVLDEKEVLEGYGAGAVDYLGKPLNPQILRSKIAVFVDLFRKTEALARANQALENEVSERQKAEEALRLANDALERRVRARTADLVRSNLALQANAEERERLLQREVAARSDLEKEGRIKDEFLATLSHELRTPLTAILAWTQILARPHVESKVAHGIAVIDRNARAQAKLVEDLLDMSRIMSGKIHVDMQPIDVSDVVDAALASVRPSAEAKGVHISRIASPRVGLVTGDAGRLQQVVWNLLTNAVKFTPAGGMVTVLVELRSDDPGRVTPLPRSRPSAVFEGQPSPPRATSGTASAQSLPRTLRQSSPGDRMSPLPREARPSIPRSHVEIVVQDTGQGIEPEFLPHVFDRFRQADGSTTRKHGGLGLGLSIVRHLVELHGGMARVESLGAGQGSTFTVELPLAVPEAEAEAPPEASSSQLAAEAPSFELPDLEGVRVLAVDDEEDTREATRHMLVACGAEVVVAASVTEALAHLEQASFDVLASDIGMPERDGYALIEEVRHREATSDRRIPAIALTAFARPEDRWRAMRAGFDIHISKPVEQMELVIAIASLTRRLRAVQRSARASEHG